MEGIIGTIYKHDDGTYSIWVGNLSKEDESKISEILSKYETEGMSVRGNLDDISIGEVIN